MLNLTKYNVTEMSLKEQEEVSGGFMWGLVFLVALGTRILLEIFN